MKRPTLEEIAAYAAHLGYDGFDAEAFFNHYESNGWMVGRTKMASWKAAIVNWRKRESEFKRKPDRAQLPWKTRQEKINQLNRRKADLMRMPPSASRSRQLEQIRIELHKL